MYDICCVGHITLDKIITAASEKQMPGGTSFYFSNAIRQMDTAYLLLTSLADSEMHVVQDLRDAGVQVKAFESLYSVCFENIYSANQDYRTQKVLQKADPFNIRQFDGINTRFFHLGPLLADDIAPELITQLAGRAAISLDVQGYLRKVEDFQVLSVDWPQKAEALQHITILKANELEAEVLTGSADIREAAIILAGKGVQEVVITLGSNGSLIYTNSMFYDIPAFMPPSIVDATGCGDTYMAGYLYMRSKGTSPEKAGRFAAAMAGIKVGASGPFTGNEQDVLTFMSNFISKQ